MRNFLKRWARDFARDDGVAGLVIAVVITVVAFTALMVILNGVFGGRDLGRVTTIREAGVTFDNAVAAYFLSQPTASRRLPCPDTDFDGEASDETCSGGDVALGTIPYLTLGLSREQAIDPYGNYYTYVVPADADTREMCMSIPNDLDSSVDPEYTGTLVEQTALEIRATSETTTGRYVPYVIYSHGRNGTGAHRLTSTVATPRRNAYPTTAYEDDNSAFTSGFAATTPNIIYSGPYTVDSDDTAPDNSFDDEIFVPTNFDLLRLCEQLTPGGQVNAELYDDFNAPGSTINPDKWDTSGSGDPPDRTSVNGDKVARFNGPTSYMATNSSYYLDPSVRPLYVSGYWTPTAVPNTFSLVTRATMPPDSGDAFTTGLTFRFGSTGIRIFNDDGLDTSVALGFTLEANEEYFIEIYDNGEDVWARITETDDRTHTVSHTATTTADLTGDQRAAFVNGAERSYINNLLVGNPMLVADFNGTNAQAASAEGTQDFAAGLRDLTLEAWVRPDVYPATGQADVIVAKWDSDETTASAQGYRLYLNSGEVHLQLAVQTAASTYELSDVFDSGFSPPLGEWTHVVATYSATTGTVRFYRNGELTRAYASGLTGYDSNNDDTIDAGGANDPTGQPFSVGANRLAGSSGAFTYADFFDGSISDVRVWQSARTASEIRSCFNKRVPNTTADCADTNLVTNWRFDPSMAQGAIASTGTAYASEGDPGAITNVSYAATRSRYFRPFSTQVCPTLTRVGVYQCDLRTTARSVTGRTMPSDLTRLYVKAWGGGGGGYNDTLLSTSSPGGGGGYSGALIEQIGGSPIGGAVVDIIVGGGGTGSSATANGAGGGGASGVMAGSNVGLVAGGGGGASYSATVLSSCVAEVGSEDQCGVGGGGGGAGTVAGALTVQANGAITPCGGKGGDNSPSGADGLDTTYCTLGGTLGGGDATTPDGGGPSTGGASSGGASDIGEGGDGYDGLANIGGGGGGGGYPLGGEAGGYNAIAGAGYGGGGGGGDRDATGAFNVVGARGIYGLKATDSTRTGSTQDTTTARRRITNISPNLSTSTWQVGDTITGAGIPGGTTITGITSPSSITISNDVTATADSVSLTVTPAAGTSGVQLGIAGNRADPDYVPRYAVSTNNRPGNAGTSATGSVNGNAGAVIFRW